MAGFFSLAGMEYTRNYIKSHREPINLINGILLPRIDDPDWKRINNHGDFSLGNCLIKCVECTDNSCCKYKMHLNIYVDNVKFDYKTDLVTKTRLYILAVWTHHMKYMVECPEIKQLNVNS